MRFPSMTGNILLSSKLPPPDLIHAPADTPFSDQKYP